MSRCCCYLRHVSTYREWMLFNVEAHASQIASTTVMSAFVIKLHTWLCCICPRASLGGRQNWVVWLPTPSKRVNQFAYFRYISTTFRSEHMCELYVRQIYNTHQRFKSVGSTGAGCRLGWVTGRVGSTLGDRCVTGRPHKMQSGTSTERDKQADIDTRHRSRIRILRFFFIFKI